VERMTLSVSNPIAEKALGILERAQEIAQEVRDSKGLALDKRAAIGTGQVRCCPTPFRYAMPPRRAASISPKLKTRRRFSRNGRRIVCAYE